MKFGFRELLFMLLLSAIPVGSYYWVFKPSNESIKQQKEQIEAKTKKLEDLQKAVKGIKDLDAEVAKLTKAVNYFESKLPAKHEIHKVLAQVTKIAAKRGLETKLFQTMKPKAFGSYSEQPIVMELNGDFDSFYQFLLDTEKLPRITRFKKMELIKDPKQEGKTVARLILSIYFDNTEIKDKPVA